MAKIKKNINEDEKKVLLLAQDIKFAKSLASNNKKIRDRALKALKKWLQMRLLRMPFTEKDFMLIWKGLFYTMWMSDKPLVQEECAENISHLVHFPTWEDSLLFFKCGLQTLVDQWFGIDQLRLDKFMMLVRRLLRQGFVVLDNEKWHQKVLEIFNDVLSETVLCTSKLPPLGLTMHFTEIYLEELAKISKGKIEVSVVTILLKPFIKQLALLKDPRQVGHIMKFIFRHLMWQSDLGMEYNERYNEWKRLGFPGGTIEVIQKQELPDDEVMSDSDSDENENVDKPLDPRAGRVDVELPQIPFDAEEISELLKHFRFIEGTTAKNRRFINKLVQEFERMSMGEFPLGVKTLPTIEKDNSTKLKNSVNRLMKFENKILSKNKRKRAGKQKFEESSENKQSEDTPKVKKRKLLENNLTGLMRNKLEDFIKKSESHIKKNLANKLNVQENEEIVNGTCGSIDNNKISKITNKRKKLATNLYEKGMTKVSSKKKNNLKSSEYQNLKFKNSFRRNSGTWYVYEVKQLKNNRQAAKFSKTSITKNSITSISNTISENEKLNEFTVEECQNAKLTSENDTNTERSTKLDISSPKSPRTRRKSFAENFEGKSAPSTIKTDSTVLTEPNISSPKSHKTQRKSFGENSEGKSRTEGSILLRGADFSSPKTRRTRRSFAEDSEWKSEIENCTYLTGKTDSTPSMGPEISSPKSRRIQRKSFAKGSEANSESLKTQTEDVTGKTGSTPESHKLKLTSDKNEVVLHDSVNNVVTSTPMRSPNQMVNSFPQSEWDLSPKEGEVEIFVPARKYQKKMEMLAKKRGKSVSSLLNTSVMKFRENKKNFSLDSNLVKNPFSKTNLMGSAKKVKIALNLNKSQEIHEHLRKIKSSPAIPFDAEKKPSKPLLKKPVIASPINPFYRKSVKRLNIL